ncbi:hypothetical protein TrVFT333_003437 [Trichoderma virens FT-333]|nr:hypothetical protein TrVFT333_003437 [Trichoderma virens FT-333]
MMIDTITTANITPDILIAVGFPPLVVVAVNASVVDDEVNSVVVADVVDDFGRNGVTMGWPLKMGTKDVLCDDIDEDVDDASASVCVCVSVDVEAGASPSSFASIAINPLTIAFEPVLKTLLPSLAVRPVRTADSVLGHALFLATGHLANVAADFVAAGFPNGAASVRDAGIALLAVSLAVGAALSDRGHAAVVAD